jgi:hypothetical protein
MKKINLIQNLIFTVAFIATITSIVVSILNKDDILWKVIALAWLSNTFWNELRIRELEDRK